VFQETKVGSAIKDVEDTLMHVDGYESFWSICSKRPGYSGVVTFVKKGLTVDARHEFGKAEFDCEGRVMMTDHGSFVLFNVYFPNSGNGDRLSYKMDFYRWFEGLCDDFLKSGRKIIIAGDVNTTHKEIDIWCSDRIQQGLFGDERKWMDHFFSRSESEPFVDTFRTLHPTSRKYSWWDVKSNQRITDQGYRLDYFLVNQSFVDQVLESDMITEQLGSDHCPIFLVMQPQTVPTVSKTPLLSSDKIKARQPSILSFFGGGGAAKKKSSSSSTSPAPQVGAIIAVASSSNASSSSSPVIPLCTSIELKQVPEVDFNERGTKDKRERTIEDDPEAKRPKLV
jgi:exodeoxyribonuclease-3